MVPPAGANGVLPATVLQKPQNAPAPRGPKQAHPRLKLICRRLPPGLTKAEFGKILGDEWAQGAGKVDWTLYRKGKISTDAAKPSKPSRAYIHVTKTEYVKILGDHVRACVFHDAAKSWQDPALIGPPALEFAPYPKLPGGRRRNDNRQATIDQDQEFKDFLESLTNPIAKPAAPENDTPKEKVKTTPLIEALREKKANREKPSKNRRGEGKDDGDKKGSSKGSKENAGNSGDKTRRVGKVEKAQAAKEAVKILNKEAASKSNATSTDKASASPAPERKRGNVALAKSMLQRDLGVGPAPSRRRGTKREVGRATTDTPSQTKDTATTNDKVKEPASQPTPVPADKPAQAAKKDRPTRAERRAYKAGLSDKSNKNPQEEAKPQATPKAPAPQILKKPAAAQLPTVPKGPAARAPPTEPAAARSSSKSANVQAPPSNSDAVPASGAVASKSTPVSHSPAASGKQAFLKHANPSQGITEPLIEEALKAYGVIEKVEIDKRKGFAYVNFADVQGLQKAMAASPIKIAQGAVQVLERKEKVARAPRFNGPPPTGPARGGGGGGGRGGGFPPRGRGGRGGRGGHAGAAPGSPATTAATPASGAT